jgi:DmsE family decaheme c-type cytochrome
MNPGESTEAEKRPHRELYPRLAVALVLLGGLFACVSQWSPPDPTGRHHTSPVAGAGAPIGARHCFDCHDSFAGHFVSGEGHADCESCHGPAELHAHTAQASDIRYPSSEDCASCHQVGSKTLLGWTTSEHSRAGVLCSDCHDTHNRELRLLREAPEIQTSVLRHAGDVTQLCASCHPEVSAQFDLPSHHPMREGMVTCTDCHSPHEDRRKTLGAQTRLCTSCHQEVAGPWIYEHAPVTEDCGHCHAPHGASADFLLEASQPAACISCHTLPIAGAVHEPYAFTTRCTNCHNSIHGSFTDPHLRR